MLAQSEENKGVELTGGRGKCWRAEGGPEREVNFKL